MEADWEPGSQDATAAGVARHGMSLPEQSTAEARANNQAFISAAVAKGDLGLAAHATQDPFSGSHDGYQVWEGFDKIGIMGMMLHAIPDTFPSFNRLKAAFNATVSLFRTAKGNSSNGSSSSANGSDSSSSTGSLSNPWLNMPGCNFAFCKPKPWDGDKTSSGGR